VHETSALANFIFFLARSVSFPLSLATVQACPDLAVVTTDAAKADYMFLIDHQRFKNVVKHNKVAFVNRAGDVVWADQTRLLPNAVKDACEFLKKNLK